MSIMEQDSKGLEYICMWGFLRFIYLIMVFFFLLKVDCLEVGTWIYI